MFIVDPVNRVLWTQAAKGSRETIRVPLDAGIVGHVATTGQPVRIEEAYLDHRFNKEVDAKTNYRTKTIITVPINDANGRVVGKPEQSINIFTELLKVFVKL